MTALEVGDVVNLCTDDEPVDGTVLLFDGYQLVRIGDAWLYDTPNDSTFYTWAELYAIGADDAVVTSVPEPLEVAA